MHYPERVLPNPEAHLIMDITIKEMPLGEVDATWDRFVLAHQLPAYSIGHNPCLPQLFKTLFQHEPVYLGCYDKEKLIGVFQASKEKGKIKSLPVLSTSGLCLNEGYDAKTIYKKLTAHLNCSFEIRDFTAFSEFVYDKKATFYLKLQKTADEQLKFFKSVIRNRINKGIKDGLQCKTGGVELLPEFYEIYIRNMHSKGVPVPSKNYFKTFIEEYKNGRCKLFVIYNEGKAIAASILYTYGKLAEFFWASTLKEYNSLNPNMVLYWEMIKYSVEQGMEIFSYGRSDMDGNNHTFKAKWNPDIIPIYFNYSSPQKNIREYSTMSRIWQKIPLPLARVLGPIIRSKVSS